MKPRNKINKMFFLLIACMIAINAFTQSEQGKNFYVAFAKKTNDDVELKLKVIATVETEETLSFTVGGIADITFTVPAGAVYEHTLDAAFLLSFVTGDILVEPYTVEFYTDKACTVLLTRITASASSIPYTFYAISRNNITDCTTALTNLLEFYVTVISVSSPKLSPKNCSNQNLCHALFPAYRFSHLNL